MTTTTTTTNQSSASNVSIMSSLQIMDVEFDFELCHSQYSYCRCWH